MNRLFADSNNGGSYIDLTLPYDYDERNKINFVYLDVGDCCVKIVDAHVPIELITYIFKKFFFKFDSIEDAIKSMNYSEEYTQKLLDKYRKYNNV